MTWLMHYYNVPKILLQLLTVMPLQHNGRLSPYTVYFHNAIVAVNILWIPLLEMPPEYLYAYP